MALVYPNELIGVLFNHVSAKSGSVTGRHYNHSSYMDLKRQLIELWCDHLMKIVGVEWVEPLHRLMMEVLIDQLEGTRGQLLAVGRLSATERVAQCLADLAHHMGTDASGAFEPPISRLDIADYLGSYGRKLVTA